MANPLSKKAIKKGSAEKPASSPSHLGSLGSVNRDVDLDDGSIEEMLPTALARVFVGSKIESMKEEIERLGLKAPSEYEGDMPELPDEIADLSHDELSNLLAAFQNALSTATWTASVHYVKHSTFEEIADYLENRAILDSDQSSEQKRKADARTEGTVVFFRGMRQYHYNQYVLHRDLGKTIEGKGKVVSRVGGFLSDDDDVSDIKADKSSTRGKGKGATKIRRR